MSTENGNDTIAPEEVPAQTEQQHAEELTDEQLAEQVQAEHDEEVNATKEPDEPQSDEEGVTERHSIGEDLFNGLKNMGFSENAIKKSIASGCVNEDTCVQWITMHQGHPELDTPLEAHIRVYVKKKRILTEEERVAKVAELKEKIKQNKANEAVALRESAMAAEKARIAMGKNAAEVKEQLEERKRKAAAEERRREKAADALAREKVQLDLAIDKLVRQGRTHEEAKVLAQQQLEEKKRKVEEERKARAEQQLREREAEEAERAKYANNTTTSGGGWNLASVLGADQVQAGDRFGTGGQEPPAAAPAPVAPTAITTGVDEFAPLATSVCGATPTIDAFRTLKQQMEYHELSTKDADGKARYMTAVATLEKILSAIVRLPLDTRKRQLRLSNTMIQTRILSVPYAATYLRLAGFEKAESGDGAILMMNSVIIRHVNAGITVLAEGGAANDNDA